MEITVSRKLLHEALGTVGRVANYRGMLVTSTVRLTADQDGLELAATNLDTTIVLRIRADVRKPGVECVPAKTLAECVAAVSADELTLKADDKHRVAVLADKGRSEIRGLSPADFPAVDLTSTVGPIHLTAGALADAFAAVTHGALAGKDAEARPVYGGVSVEARAGALHFATADGFRLAWKQIPLAASVDAFSAIVPLEAVKELLRLLSSFDEDADVAFGLWAAEGMAPSRAVFRMGGAESGSGARSVSSPDTSLATRLIEGKFPDWRRIVRERSDTTVSVDRAALQRAVASARIFTNAAGIVRLGISPNGSPQLGEVKVSAKGDLGESESTLSCGLQGAGLEILFNGRYLAEAVAAIPTDSLKLECNLPSQPGVFRPQGSDDQLAVIMPMGVNK